MIRKHELNCIAESSWRPGRLHLSEVLGFKSKAVLNHKDNALKFRLASGFDGDTSLGLLAFTLNLTRCSDQIRNRRY